MPKDTEIGDNVTIGIGGEVPNKEKPDIYSGGLATIGENSSDSIRCTDRQEYCHQWRDHAGRLQATELLGGGETLIKAGERS